MVVGVERRVAGEARERARAGDEAAEQREIVVDAELGGPCAHRRAGNRARTCRDVEAVAVAARDQSEHRRVEAVGREHRPAARIDGEERAHDAAQRVEIELMQRQPLAEQAAGARAASRTASKCSTV